MKEDRTHTIEDRYTVVLTWSRRVTIEAKETLDLPLFGTIVKYLR